LGVCAFIVRIVDSKCRLHVVSWKLYHHFNFPIDGVGVPFRLGRWMRQWLSIIGFHRSVSSDPDSPRKGSGSGLPWVQKVLCGFLWVCVETIIQGFHFPKFCSILKFDLRLHFLPQSFHPQIASPIIQFQVKSPFLRLSRKFCDRRN
jgi:hypothetical protein